MNTKSPTTPKIVVIGAGLSGLTTAWKLAEAFGGRVLLLEREEFTGGMAHTFSEGEICYDFGSHRIHRSFAPEAMGLIRDLVGEDLKLRERYGRLRLNGRYMNYPPDLAGFLKGMGLSAAFRGGADFLASRLRRRREDGAGLSYEECMISRAGKVIYDLFYAPYAWKVYGIDPKTISAHAAKIRVALKKPLAMARDLVLPKKPEKKFFYYPLHGIGTIPQELERRFLNCGGQLMTGVSVEEIKVESQRVQEVTLRKGDHTLSVPVEILISTIPINVFAQLINPPPPASVVESARALRWRAIRFLYLCVNRDFCFQSETYYYPETRYIFGRISEPKRFSPLMVRVHGKTVLCIEVICGVGDRFWRMSDAQLLNHLRDDLKELGLVESEKDIFRVFSRRLPAVYPVYDLAWQDNLRAVHRFTDAIANLYGIGRGSLFLHDNMDHALRMGLTAGEFIARHGEKTDEWLSVLSTFRYFEVRD
jgi:protoporphyrinogen oxidase